MRDWTKWRAICVGCPVDDLRAEAERHMWQPIETAPKDDREICILIYAEHCGMFRVAYYDTEADPTYPWHVEDAADGFNHHKGWPSHWQPLPDPPEK